MTVDLASHSASRLYSLPATLVSAMRFRPRADLDPAVRHPGSNLNGGDIRLLMALYAYLGSLDGADFTFTIPNAILVRLYGSVSQNRIEKALARLEATEIFTGERWLPCVISHLTRPGVPPGPKQTIGPDRVITIAGTLWSTIRQSAHRQAGTTPLRVTFAELQQLESRYALAIFLKYRAWMTGQAVPEWEHGIHPKRDAISMNVPPQEVPMVFGHEGHMAPSIMSRLFVTAGARPAISVELQRVRVDMQVVPLISRLRENGPIVYEVNFADFVRPAVAKISDLQKTSPSVMAQRPRIPHRKKKATA